MPHLPRYAIIEDSSLFHVTWQCHNKDWLLKENWAKQTYYNLLLKHKDRYHIQIYSYCFMSNHPHLSGFCLDKKKFSDFFRIVNSQFARIYNKRMNRRGQVVMDRFKSPRIDSYESLLKVMQYIDFNPIRAKMVKHPKEFQWSSFHYYAFGKEDPLITPAPTYLSLGDTEQKRRQVYLKMVEEILLFEGLAKKNYSCVQFIGDPIWVKQKNKELKEIIDEKNKKFREQESVDPPS